MKTGDRARAGDRIFFMVAAALLVAFAGLNAGHYAGRLDNPENGQDFAAYYVPAAMLRDGQTAIYAPAQVRQYGETLGIYPDRVWAQPYLYPPVVAQALLPFTFLPYATARLLWFLASCGALLGALAIVLAAAPPGHRRWIALLWLTLPHHVTSLYMGQADSLVAALLAAGFAAVGWRAWQRAGTAIAVAAAIKVTPALIAVSLLRPWQGAARAALVGVGIAAGSMLVAWAQGAPLLWLTYVTELPQLAGITRDWVENVSLSGALRRLFLETPHPLPGLLEALPFLTVPNIIAAAHAALAALLLAIMYGAAALRKQHARPGGELPRLYALAVVWLLLVAPITWPSTLSLLVVPAAWLLSAVQAAPSPRRVLAAGMVLLALWLPNAALPSLPLADWSSLRASALLALFFLTAALPIGTPAPMVWREPEQQAA